MPTMSINSSSLSVAKLQLRVFATLGNTPQDNQSIELWLLIHSNSTFYTKSMHRHMHILMHLCVHSNAYCFAYIFITCSIKIVIWEIIECSNVLSIVLFLMHILMYLCYALFYVCYSIVLSYLFSIEHVIVLSYFVSTAEESLVNPSKLVQLPHPYKVHNICDPKVKIEAYASSHASASMVPWLWQSNWSPMTHSQWCLKISN